MHSIDSAAPLTAAGLPLWKRVLFGGIATVGIPLATFALIEGGSSLILLVRDLRPGEPGFIVEPAHTNYDTLIGWVSRPDISVSDFWGPGLSLHINGQGFRNDHEITPQVPPGRIRVVCSGDSFTLGWGVDDAHAWCALLEREDPRLETVNMGQAGYGVDQAYLWYRRDGRRIDHDIQLFCVIADDFLRMHRRDYGGFAKPVLVLDGDTLRTENVPVPKWSYRMPWLTSYLYAKRPVLKELRVAGLAERLESRFVRKGAIDQDSATWRVADRVLADLVSINHAKQSKLVVVFFPERDDWSGNASDYWRRRVAAAASREGFAFVDLVEDFRRVPHDSVDLLFLTRNRHFSNRGNSWAADLLYRRLLGWPEVLDRLATPPSPKSGDRDLSPSGKSRCSRMNRTDRLRGDSTRGEVQVAVAGGCQSPLPVAP